MLELKEIRKVYPAGGENVVALKGIDLTFRKSEFVSILGPSGCGKTTMLNIIGGLDQYTDGDLVINGRSTREYRDRDWDAYRNHAIGFVFQSYNLIPHQTVLQNVELALTLSGVSKSERRKRAKQALEDVGLGSQLRKRPSEMSGGQMQRVAIARAIVNNPDIILADEPTGALDTETSVQVMDILKEISKDRLVIMVTHNPELAQRYSTRIINMLDGRITGDSMPLTSEEIAAERQEEAEHARTEGRQKKPSMSFATAFGLSLKNLFTKKGRTTLTAFAGSIGIIGIALIYAVSQGMTTYIDRVQEETLSSYPLMLQSQQIDASSLMATMLGNVESHGTHGDDAVYSQSIIYDMVNALNSLETTTNDLGAFKTYLDNRLEDDADTSGLREAVNGVQYGYGIDLPVYTENVDGQIIVSDSQSVLRELFAGFMGVNMSGSLLGGGSSGTMVNMMTMGRSSSRYDMWQEMLPGDKGAPISSLILNQYDLIYGSWANDYDEIMLVLDERNELNDITLYALGLIPRETIMSNMEKARDGVEVESSNERWAYEDICGRTYRVVLPSDAWVQDETTGLYTDLRTTEAGLRYLYNNGLELKIVGVIRPNEDALTSMLNGSVVYTSKLTQYMIDHANASAAVTAQKAAPDTDVLNGLPFRGSTGTMTDAEKAEGFRNAVLGMSAEEKGAAYVKMMTTPTDEQLDAMVAQAIGAMSREDMIAMMLQMVTEQMGMSADMVQGYIASMSDEDVTALFSQSAREQAAMQYAQQAGTKLAAMKPEQLASAMDMAAKMGQDAQLAMAYDLLLVFSDSTYEDNLKLLGCVDAGVPSTINLYASSFENKDVIETAIANYNEGKDSVHQITYTDYVGLMMSSVTTIINAITYVLIAFVAISLIVSSIMIGVITLISVQERTKEIGILRAIGASKKNVSSMFNAETVIIGFASGAVGVGITYLLCIPINLILHELTGINNLSAILPWQTAVVLVAISMLLTLISGVIPSRSAAKKDPVVALRTE